MRTQLVRVDCPVDYCVINMKMDGPVHDEKSSSKMLGLFFSFKLDWCPYIVPIPKTASKYLEP